MSRAMPVNIRWSPICNSLTAKCIGNVRAVFAEPEHLAADADDLLVAGRQIVDAGSRRARRDTARASASSRSCR